ncbi:hypothetical protein BJX63DRAFT_414713 [Aspergillus granulosus]|uniref:Zn(2)-C6 fungal-type domain-containing protein n=1 Tax=Aspergillus granulosus TaxID=176169 RepID=A0ABR4GUH0_9EURO
MSTYVSSACDVCRRRKVKCDLADPCSNCRVSGFECERTAVPKKRGRKLRKPSADLPMLPNYRQLAPCSPLLEGRQSVGSPWPTVVLPTHPDPSSSPSVANSPSIEPPNKPEWILRKLIGIIQSIPSLGTLESIVSRCIDLYLKFIFPNQPLIHEPTIRASVAIFSPEVPAPFERCYNLFTPPQNNEVALLRAFTLLTALSAFVASVIPDQLLPSPHNLADVFLRASREMLQVYQDYDLENPDSSSLNIRMWHSAALQNTTGKVGASWHSHGEATLLAQRLRLFDEESVRQTPSVEAQLLRSAFWHLYSAERSAEALESRPVVLHEVLFHGELTVLEHTEHDEVLLDVSKEINQGSFEHHLRAGFRVKCRVWTLAARLISAIKAYSRRRVGRALDVDDHLAPGSLTVSRLTDAYIDFSNIVDELPETLLSLDSATDTSLDGTVSSYQRTCFMVQRSNIMTTFHCMRLIALQHCVAHDLVEIMGLSTDTASLAMKKIEIASEFLRELRLVSFVCFKVQGETAVEKVRRVGAFLMEVIQTVQHYNIKARAGSLFERLLDYLSQLDSRASDELSGLYVR